MRDASNIVEIGDLHPDYMGFIFYRGSKRFVGENFRIPGKLSQRIKRVGVFVNETPERMLQIAGENKLDYLQLHGNESEEQCGLLRKNGHGVIKAFNVDSNFDFGETSKFVGIADFFLFDARGISPGGNGVTFDWSRLQSYDQKVPFFLAGGISGGDIQQLSALKGMNLHAIDVNSGVESAPASKDKTRVIELIKKMREYGV
ncbi:MAG TPA: phosphoribosylanthranilate isomerase [Cyclobacteriaceae bacterium]|nr:phosphoribosylanthranilate isomerase [Cyclobacteriaceae bacterium]